MIQENVVSRPRPLSSLRPLAEILSGMRADERFNVMSHLVGALLSGIGTLALVLPALRIASPGKVLAFGVYGICTVGSYLASIAYHAARGDLRVRRRRCDRATIYFAIAGCYTPVVMIGFQTTVGMVALGSVWGIAAVSAIREFRPATGGPPRSIASYILMGSGFLVASGHLVTVLTLQGLAWLMAACAIYLVGALVLYCPSIPRHHEIWHVFVLLGNACTFIVMRYYLA